MGGGGLVSPVGIGSVYDPWGKLGRGLHTTEAALRKKRGPPSTLVMSPILNTIPTSTTSLSIPSSCGSVLSR